MALGVAPPSAPGRPLAALLPGALLVAIGFQVLHEVVVIYLVPKLEKLTSLYGSLGAATTIIFFVYLVATLVVASPILNSSLHEELLEDPKGVPT